MSSGRFHHHILPLNQSNWGCRASLILRGAAARFLVSFFRDCEDLTFTSATFALLESEDCNCASACRALAETSSANDAGGASGTATTGAIAAATVGVLVSKTTRSGSFIPEWMRIVARGASARSIAGRDGRHTPVTSNNKSSAPPTKRKYRATGIWSSTPPHRCVWPTPASARATPSNSESDERDCGRSSPLPLPRRRSQVCQL